MLLRAEIQRRGGHTAERMVAMADGAPCIWERFRQIAPHAIMTRVEAGCKTVIGSRLKQSGMFWSESAAQGMFGLRCHYKSGLFSSAWNNADPIHFPVAS
jgi:hypothetical protein